MVKTRDVCFEGRYKSKGENALTKASQRQAVSVPGSDKWLCSLTSESLGLHVLSRTGNFKQIDKIILYFFVR